MAIGQGRVGDRTARESVWQQDRPTVRPDPDEQVGPVAPDFELVTISERETDAQHISVARALDLQRLIVVQNRRGIEVGVYLGTELLERIATDQFVGCELGTEDRHRSKAL